MIIKSNEKLAKYTTIKIGGIAKKMFIPENKEELLDIVEKIKNIKILGAGSNLLINDKKEYENVVCLKSFATEINYADGMFYVGASVSNQALINEINKWGFGGIEYLYSVPGFVGGAIVMNAGRGKNYNQSISDYILKVDVLVDGVVKTFLKDECEFTYRHSIFKKSNCIVLGAYFIFNDMKQEVSKELKRERLELCRKVQDASKPNFGTFFCKSNPYIMKFLSKMSLGNKKGCHFSRKTVNWIINEGNGTYQDVIKLVRTTQLIHKIFNKKCELEVIIWD